MMDRMKELGIDQWPISERVTLMLQIWESIDSENIRPPLTEAMRNELSKRMAEHEAKPTEVIPWEQIKAEALARFHP